MHSSPDSRKLPSPAYKGAVSTSEDSANVVDAVQGLLGLALKDPIRSQALIVSSSEEELPESRDRGKKKAKKVDSEEEDKMSSGSSDDSSDDEESGV